MAEKIFTNVRLGLKVDTLENWLKSDLVLKRGEVAFATVAATAGTGLTEPVCMMRIGDGEKTFSELGWDFYAKASDVVAAAKSETGLTDFITNVINNSSLATDGELATLAGRVEANEGAIETLNGDAETAGSVAKAIADAIAALDLENVVSGLEDAIADAKQAGTDASAALDEYKTANDAAVKKVADDLAAESEAARAAEKANADAITAMKDHESVDSFADVMAEVAKKVDVVEGKSLVSDTEITRLAGMSDGANKVEASETNGNIKIDGVETTVYTHPAKHNITDIEGLQEALDGKQGSGDFAAEDHKHTKEDITDFEHTHTASEVTDLDATIKTYDYATKAEAQGYVDTYKTANDKALADEAEARANADAGLQSAIDAINNTESGLLKQAKDYADGKDTAIQSAQDAADAAQDAVDTLAGKVGEVTEGKTVVQMIADAQTAATYNDSEVRGLISDNADAIAAEKERAEGVEGGLETRLAAVEADYLTSSDKEALQTQINTIMNNPDAEGAINSINEFTTYVTEHGTIAEGMRADINKNKEDIAAEAERAAGVESGLNTRLETLEAIDHEAYKAYADQAEADAIAAAKEDASNKDAVVLVEAQKAATAAETAAKEYAEGLDSAMNTRVEALEAVDHEHANATVLDGIEATDIAAWDAKVDDVTAATDSGLKATRTGNTVAIEIDESVTWIFDCGDAGVTTE